MSYITKSVLEGKTIWLWSATRNKWVRKTPSDPNWYKRYDICLTNDGYFQYNGSWWYLGVNEPEKYL